MRSSHEPYSSLPTSGGASGGTSAAASGGSGRGSPLGLSDELIATPNVVAASVRSWDRIPKELGHIAVANGRRWDRYLVRAVRRCRRANVMSRNQAVAGLVNRTRQLHATLRDERGEQLIEQSHDVRIAGQFVRTELLDG